MGIETEDGATMSDEDRMAAEWAAALAETKDVDDTSGPSAGRGPAPAFGPPVETVAPASFAQLAPTGAGNGGNDIQMILDIPVQLTVELGRTRIPIW